MKRKILFTILTITCSLFLGCSSSTDAVQTENPIKTESMDEHSYLNGLWTTDNKSKDSILNHGGSYLEITVLNNNEIKGTLVSIQGGTQRIASITFTSYIKNDELIYKYDDDGFDNSGTVVMKLSKDKIIVSNNTTLADSNTSGWSINSVELTKYK